MAIRNVNPGDLITALDWNSLIDMINAMDVRLTQLEATGPGGPDPRITQILPPGPVTAGDTISIFGSNFDFSKSGQSVFFGNTRASGFLAGSSDTLLIVEVPDPVEGAVPTGTQMTLSVGNLVGVAVQSITVKSKPIVTHGGLAFTFKGTRPSATPASGAAFFYDFELKSLASEDLVVTITPTIAVILPLPGGVVDPGLTGLLVLIDADSTERLDHTVPLLEGATKTISLRLTLPPGVDNLKYSLSATASAPGVDQIVESLPDQQVGHASEQPDSTVTTFEFSSIADGNAAFSVNTGGMAGVDGTVSVAAGTNATIELRTIFANIPNGVLKNYTLTAVIEGAAGGWTTGVNSIMQNPLPVTGPGGIVFTDFDVHAPAVAATAKLRLTLTRADGAPNNKRSVAYRLILK